MKGSRAAEDTDSAKVETSSVETSSVRVNATHERAEAATDLRDCSSLDQPFRDFASPARSDW